MKTAAGLENVFVSPKEYEQMIRAEERAAIVKWIWFMARENPAHRDMLEMIAGDIERAEYAKQVELSEVK